MRYGLKQKLWSWGDTYDIFNAEQVPVLRVQGKAFSWGDKLQLCDMQGNELAFIEQKLMSMIPRYKLFRNGGLFAEIRKEATWFTPKFTLDVPGPNDYTITGSMAAYDYRFERGGRTIATVSKAMWSWSDSYGVDIQQGEDDLAILATVIVIDLVSHNDQ